MFYESIANVYDYIFPQNQNQLTFIEKISPIKSEDIILDIGCATGNLTELLTRKSQNVIGIDLDSELLSYGHSKNDNLELIELNMLDINQKFGDNSIDKIISFGNTLVHLQNRADVKVFFENVYKTLKTNGSFTVQIINYDRIIDQNICSLSTIDNEYIRFVRDYLYKKEDLSVEFITELTIKSNDQVIRNNITLLALRKDEITAYLKAANFKDIKFYGDLQGAEINNNSVPMIFSCIK